MPLPLILGVGAAIAGIAGVGTGVHGAVKMKEANDTIKRAEMRHKNNIEKLQNKSELTSREMDALGELELKILNEFDDFSNTIEKIQNRPQFKQYSKDGVTLPKYDKEELKSASIGAGVLLGGLGGAVAGTAGGFAAAGATTSAVMALGTASTGTAISSLSGAAATNATLAALGGGAIGSSATAGGMALGSTILGATTLGVGLLVGGMIFNFTGGKLSNQADEAYNQMRKAEDTINKACNYLTELESISVKYSNSLTKAHQKYLENFNYISYVVNKLNKVDWNEFNEDEKIATQNSILLVGLLYKMCQVNIVNRSENENNMNTINISEVGASIRNSEQVIVETIEKKHFLQNIERKTKNEDSIDSKLDVIECLCKDFSIIHDDFKFDISEQFKHTLRISGCKKVYLSYKQKEGPFEYGFAITSDGIFCINSSKLIEHVSFLELSNSSNIDRRGKYIYTDGKALAYYSGSYSIKDDLVDLFKRIKVLGFVK